jgi:hypothetical protein
MIRGARELGMDRVTGFFKEGLRGSDDEEVQLNFASALAYLGIYDLDEQQEVFMRFARRDLDFLEPEFYRVYLGGYEQLDDVPPWILAALNIRHQRKYFSEDLLYLVKEILAEEASTRERKQFARHKIVLEEVLHRGSSLIDNVRYKDPSLSELVDGLVEESRRLAESLFGMERHVHWSEAEKFADALSLARETRKGVFESL